MRYAVPEGGESKEGSVTRSNDGFYDLRDEELGSVNEKEKKLKPSYRHNLTDAPANRSFRWNRVASPRKYYKAKIAHSNFATLESIPMQDSSFSMSENSSFKQKPKRPSSSIIVDKMNSNMGALSPSKSVRVKAMKSTIINIRNKAKNQEQIL
jgi:hypothetical protein